MAAVLSVELSANPDKLLAGFKRADEATGAYAAAAQRHMVAVQATFNGVEFSTTTNKAKAETLKLIELQHQLTVATVSGDKAQATALSEQITLLQKIKQLRSAGFSHDDAVSAAKQSVEAVALAREAAEEREARIKRSERLRGNPGEALAGAFGRTRLGVLEEGGAKVPIFGASLEALGGAGLVAAAGLAAVAVTAEKVRQSMEFAEDVERTSKALGVSTTALQAYDSAAIATSIGQDKARDSLRSFNEVFGKYSSGLASAKQAKFFDALGFTPATAREIGDTTEALEKTLRALAEVKNPQQRASFAESFGLSAFLPILAEGSEGVEKFVKKMEDARNSGGVVSPEQIKQAAELNDQVEEISHHIDQEFKKAFIDLAPEVLKVAQFLDQCATAVARLIGKLPDAAVGLEDLAAKAKKALDVGYKAYLISQGRFVEAARVGQQGTAEPGAPSPLQQAGSVVAAIPGTPQYYYHLLHKTFDHLTNEGRVARLRGVGGIDYLDGGKHPFEAGSDPRDFGPAEGRGGDYTPPKKPKKDHSAEKALEREKADYDKGADAQKAALQQQQAELQARAALVGSIEDRGVIEDQIAKVQLDEKKAALEKQARDAEYDARLGHISQAAAAQERQEAEKGKANADIIFALQSEARLRDRAIAIAQRDFELQQRQAELAERREAAQLPTSNRARADQELDLFRQRQQDGEAVAKHADDSDTSLTPEVRRQRAANLRATDRAELIRKRQDVQREASPLYAEAHPLTSIGDDLERVEAEGVSRLGDGLEGVVTGTKRVQDAFHDMSVGIIADLAKIFIQREIEAPLANLLFNRGGSSANLGNLFATGGSVSVGSSIDSLFAGGFLGLPGHASGSDNFGGVTRLNELIGGGPEGVAYLPNGTQIIPNATLRGLAKIDPASLGRGGGNITQEFHLHAEGAVMTDDLVRSLGAQAQAMSIAAATSAVGRNNERQVRRATHSRRLG